MTPLITYNSHHKKQVPWNRIEDSTEEKERHKHGFISMHGEIKQIYNLRSTPSFVKGSNSLFHAV